MKHFEISVRDFCTLLELDLIKESKQGTLNGIYYRLDSPNAYTNQQKHVHIGDYVWNLDGSRSHTSKWPNKEPTKKIRNVAAKVLDVDVTILEQNFEKTVTVEPKSSQILLESQKFWENYGAL